MHPRLDRVRPGYPNPRARAWTLTHPHPSSLHAWALALRARGRPPRGRHQVTGRAIVPDWRSELARGPLWGKQFTEHFDNRGSARTSRENSRNRRPQSVAQPGAMLRTSWQESVFSPANCIWERKSPRRKRDRGSRDTGRSGSRWTRCSRRRFCAATFSVVRAAQLVHITRFELLAARELDVLSASLAALRCVRCCHQRAPNE